MSDKIIGTAVLDRTRTNSPDSDSLHVLCTYTDGTYHHSGIPVHLKGTTPYKQPSWEYEIKGDEIHVTPSLRISTTRPSKTNPDQMEPVELFHNDGAWSVKFQEFKPGGEYVQAYDLFRALNPK